MARKIQIKRGNKAKLPTLAQGELALVLDEQSLYGGGASGNIPLGGKAITPALIGAVSKAGDTMTGTLTVPRMESKDGNIRGAIRANSGMTALLLSTFNDQTGAEYVLAIKEDGPVFIDESGYIHPIYHAGNKPTASDVGAVKKAGDTMTGTLTLPAAEIKNNRIWAHLTPDSSLASLLIGIYDDDTGLESSFAVGTDGLKFYDRLGNSFTVIHTGNMAQFTGVAQASLE